MSGVQEHTPRFGFALPEDQGQRDRLAEIGQIASGLVHELKNPLGAISLNVEMLQGQCDRGQLEPEKTRTRLRRIAAGTSQLQDIIVSFLHFARPGKPQRERVNLNHLCQELLDEQAEVFSAAAIHVDFRTAPDIDAIPADPSQIRSVLLNILLNARDALQERESQRRILVATRSGHELTRIVVANNGPPLSEQAAAHLFDPFFSAKEGGTGLGLAIASRLIELHGGTITVSSDPHQGVSFTLAFPTNLGRAQAHEELPIPIQEASVQAEDDHGESAHH